MNRITVFCGSSFGNKKEYETQAFQLGQIMSENNIDLVYGGAKVGLMGAVADGVLNKNGKVIGVLPDFLMKKEIAHDHLTELIIVKSA